MPEENRPPRPVLAGRHSCAPRKSQVYHHGVHHLFRRVRQGFRPQGVQVCQAVRAMRAMRFRFSRASTIRDRVTGRARAATSPSDRWMRSYRDRVTPGSRSRIGASSGRDANDATVLGVTRGVWEERKSSLTRIARGTPRGDARRRRSASTVPWGSFVSGFARDRERSGRYAFGETDRARPRSRGLSRVGDEE